MKEVLEEILKELKYQTQIMEFFYDKKDSAKHDYHDRMKNIKKAVMCNPIFESSPEAKAMLEDMFDKMSGGKS